MHNVRDRAGPQYTVDKWISRLGIKNMDLCSLSTSGKYVKSLLNICELSFPHLPLPHDYKTFYEDPRNIFNFSIMIDIQCYISFSCANQWLEIYITYEVIILIIVVPTWRLSQLLPYFCLYSLCCTLHPWDWLLSSSFLKWGHGHEVVRFKENVIVYRRPLVDHFAHSNPSEHQLLLNNNSDFRTLSNNDLSLWKLKHIPFKHNNYFILTISY